jgi:hypothetical protein
MALALAISMAACDRGLTEVNENPNDPADAPSKFLIVQAIRETANRSVAGTMNYRYAGVWAQHFAEIQYSDEDRYKFRPGDLDGLWDEFYSNPLLNLHRIAERNESPNQVAIALTLKSLVYQVMTDLWGDIPYSEALSGDKEDGTLTPRYDKQSDIYAGLLADLTKAVAQIDASAPRFGAEELIYGGNMDRWRKFANSLRLRVAMRMSEVDPARAASEFQAALDGGVFTSNADNAVLRYSSDSNSRHPMHNDWRGRDDYSVSKTLVDILTNGDATGADLANHDPRLAIFAERTVSDTARITYRGHQNGMPDGHGVPLGTISRIGNRWRSQPNGDGLLMSYAEVLFLQAEAAERGWIAGDAEELYNAAIIASMTYYGIEAATAEAYLAGRPEWDFDAPGSTPLRQIAIQKWIALYNNGPEAFAEWRRTGWPELKAGPAAENSGRIIRRWLYPGKEQSVNGDNLNAAVAAQGLQSLADMNTRMWWDQKPLVP